jgi:hypothetical protein
MRTLDTKFIRMFSLAAGALVALSIQAAALRPHPGERRHARPRHHGQRGAVEGAPRGPAATSAENREVVTGVPGKLAVS